MKKVTVSQLSERLDKLEKLLVSKKIIRIPGADIVDARWSSWDGSWEADFAYACDCGEEHLGVVTIRAKAKDGQLYEVQGECGRTNKMRIWKSKALAL